MSERLLDFPGEIAASRRSIDWAPTPLGAVSSWSTSLKTIVGVVLGNRFPMLLAWGPELLQLYNDAYRPMLGEKHPASLGAPAREVWSEIWPIIGPMVESGLGGGPATWSENLELSLSRNGYLEETYFTFSCSPVSDDDGSV